MLPHQDYNMGFNKCYLPSIDIMETQLVNEGLEEFVKLYSKYECIIGESDRVRFLEDKIKEYQDKINYTPII